MDVMLIQEMEAVMKLLFTYAVDDSQQSNVSNSSLLPWYHKAIIAATNKNTYEVMVLTRQAPTTKLNNWQRCLGRWKSLRQLESMINVFVTYASK